MEKPIIGNEKITAEKETEKHASFILENLGLTWDDLKEKKTLDIGAGEAEIGIVATKKGLDVISFDIKPSSSGAPFVRGSADKLPFNDESFDLVMSHAGPLIFAPAKKLLSDALREALRVLKQGGEIRFGPGYLDSNIFAEGELFSKEEDEKFSDKERMMRVNEKALEYLKKEYPDVEQIITGDFDENTGIKSYYKIQKANEPETLQKS